LLLLVLKLDGMLCKSSDSSCIYFASIPGPLFFLNWYLLRSLPNWKIDIFQVPLLMEVAVFIRSLCCTWNKCLHQVPLLYLEWLSLLLEYQVPLLIEMIIFTRSLCWLKWVSLPGPSADWNECILQVPLLIEVLSFSGPFADWNEVGSFPYCMLSLEGLKGIPSPSALFIDLSSSHKNCWKLKQKLDNGILLGVFF